MQEWWVERQTEAAHKDVRRARGLRIGEGEAGRGERERGEKRLTQQTAALKASLSCWIIHLVSPSPLYVRQRQQNKAGERCTWAGRIICQPNRHTAGQQQRSQLITPIISHFRGMLVRLKNTVYRVRDLTESESTLLAKFACTIKEFDCATVGKTNTENIQIRISGIRWQKDWN